MHLAWVGPVRPARCQQAAHSEWLLPEIAQRATVDLFVDRYQPENPVLREVCKVHHIPTLAVLGPHEVYDHIVYQLANDTAHLPILDLIIKAPGVLDLHDIDLADLFARAGPGAVRQMGTLFYFARGIIVHSSRQRDVIASLCSLPLRHIPWPQEPIGPVDRAEMVALRGELGLPPEAFVVVSAGDAPAPPKLAAVIEALALLLPIDPDLRFIHLGEMPASSTPTWQAVRAATGIFAEARATGPLSEAEFRRYLRCADVCIGLDDPATGDGLAGVWQALGAGKPVVLAAETPDVPEACCWRVPDGMQQPEALADALLSLRARPDRRQEMGAAGAMHVTAEHAPVKVARQYVEFLAKLGRAPGGPEVARRTPTLEPEPAPQPEPALQRAPALVTPLQGVSSTAQAIVGEPLSVGVPLANGQLSQQVDWLRQHGGDLYLVGCLVRADADAGSAPWVRQQLALTGDLSRGWSVDLPTPGEAGTYRLEFTLEGELPDRSLLRLAHWPLDVSVIRDSRAPGLLCAAILSRQRPVTCQPGETVQTVWTVHNQGDTRWNHAANAGGGFVRLGAHLRDSQGQVLNWDFARVALPKDVYPHEAVQMQLAFVAPPAPGAYRVEVDLVNELQCWFQDRGSPTVVLELIVQ